MATRNWFLTTAKALERALTQAEFDRPATDSAPFFYGTPCVIDHDPPTPVVLSPDHNERISKSKITDPFEEMHLFAIPATAPRHRPRRRSLCGVSASLAWRNASDGETRSWSETRKF
jgi:hypothetical protein